MTGALIHTNYEIRMCRECEDKVKKYLKNARPWFENLKIQGKESDEAKHFYEMATSYYKDALHFYEKNEYANSLAALEYAEGWLDAGCAIGFFKKY